MGYSRVRSVGPTTVNGSVHYKFQVGNCSNGNLATQSEGDSNSARSYTFEEMRDIVTPRFRQRVAAGEIINNPYVHTWYSWTQPDVDWKGTKPSACPSVVYKDYRFNGVSYAPVGDILPLSNALLQAAYTEASTKARANLNESIVPGLVILGELRETINLFKNPLGGLTKIIGKTHKSGKPKKAQTARSLYEQAKNSWLTARYGWRPFLLSIEDIMEATVERKRKRITARASASGTSTESDTLSKSVMSHIGSICVREASHTYSVRAGILASVESDANYTAGIRLRDIPSAAWELIPYSFVADWFFNIGDFVEAVIPSGNVQILAEWLTSDVISHQTETITPGQYSDYTGKPTSPISVVSYYRVRSRTTALPAPGITFKSKSIAGLLSLSDWRVLDTLALLSGKRPKGARR